MRFASGPLVLAVTATRTRSRSGTDVKVVVQFRRSEHFTRFSELSGQFLLLSASEFELHELAVLQIAETKSIRSSDKDVGDGPT
jgi:hypothetical protein